MRIASRPTLLTLRQSLPTTHQSLPTRSPVHDVHNPADKNHPLTQACYATVQNKRHWAIHGKTAAEMIADRIDSSKPNMRLMTWKQAPVRPIRREDVKVAKNFLNEDEIRRLNRLVTRYLDFAESMAVCRCTMTAADCKERLDAFFQFNELEVLDTASKVSHAEAIRKALNEYDKWEE